MQAYHAYIYQLHVLWWNSASMSLCALTSLFTAAAVRRHYLRCRLQPLCSQLNSTDPATKSAARIKAVQFALAVGKSDLLYHLGETANSLHNGLLEICMPEHDEGGTNLQIVSWRSTTCAAGR